MRPRLGSFQARARPRPLDLLSALVVVLIASISLYPAARAGFVLVDDHEILSFTRAAAADAQLGPAPNLVQRIFRLDAAMGRVRPLYWAVRYAESLLFGPRPDVWHVAYAGLGVACSLLLYASLRQIDMGRLPSTAAALWLLVAPGVSSVWIRLGPQESLGTFWPLLALWSLVRSARPHTARGWTWLYLGAAVAATLTKESFALVPPALLLLDVMLLLGGAAVRTAVRRALTRSALPVAAGAAVVGAALVTARLAGPASYGGAILQAPTTGATLSNVNTLLAEGGAALVMPLVGAVSLAIRGPRRKPILICWCGGLAVFGALVLPQLLLYRGAPGFLVGRYILPSGLGLAVGFARELAVEQRFALAVRGVGGGVDWRTGCRRSEQVV